MRWIRGEVLKRMSRLRMIRFREYFCIVRSKRLPLHHAHLISYLKGFDKPLGILANFGARSVEHATYPNKTDQKIPLADHSSIPRCKADLSMLI